MAVIEALEDGQAHVEGFREELGKVRHALDNTDTALAIAEEGLHVAEDAIQEARRAMPVIITVTVVVTAAAIGVYAWRRRKKNQDQQNG